MILTGSQIKEFAEAIGLTVTGLEDNYHDTEWEIKEYPETFVFDDDGSGKYYEFAVSLSDYPEDGVIPIGNEVNNES